MKAYVGTTGVIFAVVTILHLARSRELSHEIATEPWSVAAFALLTLLTAALSVWAWRLFSRLNRPRIAANTSFSPS